MSSASKLAKDWLNVLRHASDATCTGPGLEVGEIDSLGIEEIEALEVAFVLVTEPVEFDLYTHTTFGSNLISLEL
jgi:hypothetical protein